MNKNPTRQFIVHRSSALWHGLLTVPPRRPTVSISQIRRPSVRPVAGSRDPATALIPLTIHYLQIPNQLARHRRCRAVAAKIAGQTFTSLKRRADGTFDTRRWLPLADVIEEHRGRAD